MSAHAAALAELVSAVDKLRADMRARALSRGDYELAHDGTTKIAILDCGSGVLFALNRALERGKVALADRPTRTTVVHPNTAPFSNYGLLE